MSTTPPEDSWPTRDEDATVVARDDTLAGGPPPPPPPPGGPGAPPPEDEPGNRIGAGMLLGILLLALAAGAGLAIWLFTRDDSNKTTTVVVTTAPTTGNKVSVPRVVGLKEPQALARLAEARLRPKEVYKPTKQPKSVVVSQSPQEATEVKAGSQVTLVIDSGAPKVAVPDLKGAQADDAVAKLDAIGLDSRRTEVTSGDAAGTVVDQAPQPGAKLAKGSVVTLSVAKAAPVAVPDVVGKAEADATATLKNAGFEVNAVQVPGTPKGQVKAQSPAAGEQAAKGTSVRINVGDGSGGGGGGGTTTRAGTTTAPTTTGTPTIATVPDLAGTNVQSAAQQLTTAGLLASFQYVPGQDPLGTVLQQSPAAGQNVKPRTHVTVNASTGPGNKPQKSVPNAVGQTLDQAVSTMNGAGLRLIFQKLPVATRAQAGKVVEQTPKPGSTAPQNAQVLVYIGAFRG